ncbi:hypothetical protein DFJ73DRAFT_779126 [Zopfochytrium polystomum]|nr:hypothetical protein DFJ73DRAFT_779126 [Zopfochytrium polystomum]
MCYPVRCATCGKTTWGGCGLHVSSVMSTIPVSQRCGCPRSAASSGLLFGLPPQVWLVLAVAAYLLWQRGAFDGLFGGGAVGGVGGGERPARAGVRGDAGR